MSNNTIRVLVSIVNYNSSDLVCRMLKQLVSQLDITRDKVIIVDNNSPDDSVQVLRKFIDAKDLKHTVLLVESEDNGGFSYGNNLAIKHAINYLKTPPEYVWLLNPDTYLLDDALNNLTSFFHKYPDAGILGSSLEGENGELQESAFRFHSLKSELLSGLRLGVTDKLFSKYLVSPRYISTQPEIVDWLAGASMFIRYSVIEDIGLMDENYFLYFEETDFCLQAKKSGWDCWFVPSSRVIHYVGQSTGIVSGDSLRRRRPKYWFKSRQHYFLKNYGLFYTALADLSWGVMFSLHKILDIIRLRFKNDPKYLWFDFWRNSIFFSWLDRL
ncbi:MULTISPECIES: glycosyltransferase family 2 protein [Methylophaga]|uniref:glycosyltransferase family 2 protein n=1 Tax=Methylophaga TaxID=40222 RepID=UPI002355166C|nr:MULTISPECIES: glycosyltransferase family 2 protein [Methylophaga]